MILFRYLLFVVFSFATISLNGCVNTKSPYDHPPEWFKPEKQQESCPDLAGTYDNMSVVDPDILISLSLFNRFIPRLTRTYSDCNDCSVDIRWIDNEQNTLAVAISDPTGRLETASVQLERSSGDYRCENGALVIDYGRAFELVIVGGYTKGTDEFYKGADGSILCKTNYSSFAHQFYYIPIFYSAIDQTNFLRWEQYSPPAPLKLLTPDEKLAVIVSYVEKSLASDMLQESSRSEPNEFVNILNQCGDMLSRDNITGVCEILNKAYKLSDGLESPPDLIEGQVREGISDQILFLMVFLKCQLEIEQE